MQVKGFSFLQTAGARRDQWFNFRHMSRRRRAQHPQPPEGTPERRQDAAYGRRDTDTETHEIAELAVERATLVSRLLHTGKVASAVGAIALVGGSMLTALNRRIVGPSDDIAALRRDMHAADTMIVRRVDVNSAAIVNDRSLRDSLVRIVLRLEAKIDNMAFSQCVLARKIDSDLRPDGCDATPSKQQGTVKR